MHRLPLRALARWFLCATLASLTGQGACASEALISTGGSTRSEARQTGPGQEVAALRKELAATLAQLRRREQEHPATASVLAPIIRELERQLAQLDARPSSDRSPVSPPEKPSTAPPQASRHRLRGLTISLDTRLGFDEESTIARVETDEGGSEGLFRLRQRWPTNIESRHHGEERPLLVSVNAERFAASAVLAADYPLGRATAAHLYLPYLHQSARISARGRSFRLSGERLGDVALFVDHRFPEIGRGTELTLGLGLQFPTGSDPFELDVRELPTGLGFYQPRLRIGIRKLLVPLQFYATAEYGSSFSRKVDHQTLRLPDTYGGEVGAFFSLGPEFMLQSSLSFRRASSPLVGVGIRESYFSQGLIYHSGRHARLRGAVDVGLTQESFDLWLGFTYQHRF